MLSMQLQQLWQLVSVECSRAKAVPAVLKLDGLFF